MIIDLVILSDHKMKAISLLIVNLFVPISSIKKKENHLKIRLNFSSSIEYKCCFSVTTRESYWWISFCSYHLEQSRQTKIVRCIVVKKTRPNS